MCAKIIDSRRYKTITKSQLEKKRRNNEKRIKNEKKVSLKTQKVTSSSSTKNEDKSSIISNLKLKMHTKKKKEQEMLLYTRPKKEKVINEDKKKIYIPKQVIIAGCIVFAIGLSILSVKLTKLDEKLTTTVFNNNTNDTQINNVPLETNYSLKVALSELDTTDAYATHNLILNDVYKNVEPSLVKIKNNYDIYYMLSKNVEKVTDTEYKVTLNDTYKYNADDIRFSIDKIKGYGEGSTYYSRVENIYSVEDSEEKNTCKVILYNADPYFVYKLDFPILDDQEKINGGYTYTQYDNSLSFNREKNSGYLNLDSITVMSYNSLSDIITDFGEDRVDVFFATSNNDMQLIGKKDYNVKKYKDGETLFIYGNKESRIFSQKEVRTALMYSLNREDLLKKADNNFIEIIDLPFLYSSIKYKYDIAGAKNIMNANGWWQNGYGIYETNKDEYMSATLRLLVNAEDNEKVNYAQNVKDMAREVGIDIQIEALSKDEITQKVQSRDYDLVIATTFVNDIPDIEYLREYVDINDATTQAFEQVKNSSVEDLAKNIQNLEYVLSDEVACIGLYARNINMVYQKYLYFTDINYMNIFSNLSQIGKIAN